MQTERMRILEMLQQGRINAEQANRLLEALERSRPREARSQEPSPPGAAEPGARERANYSDFRLTRRNLSRMQDGTPYVNYGSLAIADDVPEELLERKIGDYVNYGKTTGPANLVAILEDRCTTNYGHFEERAAEGP